MDKTKEDFHKEWNTCRYCGITADDIKKKKGNYQSNYVMAGICSHCRDKQRDRDDFKEAKENGKITRDDDIMCPYCGYVLEDDLSEYRDDDSFDCPECEKESELSIDYTAHFTTTKK